MCTIFLDKNYFKNRDKNKKFINSSSLLVPLKKKNAGLGLVSIHGFLIRGRSAE